MGNPTLNGGGGNDKQRRKQTKLIKIAMTGLFFTFPTKIGEDCSLSSLMVRMTQIFSITGMSRQRSSFKGHFWTPIHGIDDRQTKLRTLQNSNNSLLKSNLLQTNLILPITCTTQTTHAPDLKSNF